MTPQEHFEKAETYAHDAWFQDAETAPMRAALAQAHATLALAGFTRDALAIAERATTPEYAITVGHPTIPCPCGQTSHPSPA